MLYELRHNRWYIQLIRYPKRIRYYGTLLAVIILIGGWYVLLYKPLNRVITSYEKAHTQLRDRYRQLEQEHGELEKLSLNISSMQKDFEGYKSMPHDINSVIANLIDQASVGQIHLESCTAETLEPHGWFHVLPINVTLSGSVEQLVSYLQLIFQSNKMCFSPQLSMTFDEHKNMKCQILIHHTVIS